MTGYVVLGGLLKKPKQKQKRTNQTNIKYDKYKHEFLRQFSRAARFFGRGFCLFVVCWIVCLLFVVCCLFDYLFVVCLFLVLGNSGLFKIYPDSLVRIVQLEFSL